MRMIFLCRRRRFAPVFTRAILNSPAVPWAPVAHIGEHLLPHPAAAILNSNRIDIVLSFFHTQRESGFGWMKTTLLPLGKLKGSYYSFRGAITISME